jgi:hypothetical protein
LLRRERQSDGFRFDLCCPPPVAWVIGRHTSKLINRCFCSIGNSLFQGILPSLCVTHFLGEFVTDLLGSYQAAR